MEGRKKKIPGANSENPRGLKKEVKMEKSIKPTSRYTKTKKMSMRQKAEPTSTLPLLFDN
jgi:hypothetical protein